MTPQSIYRLLLTDGQQASQYPAVHCVHLADIIKIIITDGADRSKLRRGRRIGNFVNPRSGRVDDLHGESMTIDVGVTRTSRQTVINGGAVQPSSLFRGT